MKPIEKMLGHFTGLTKANETLTAANVALLAGLGLAADAVAGKTPEEIKTLVAAKIAPAAPVAAPATLDLKSVLATAKIPLLDGQTLEQSLASHAAAHATLAAAHSTLLSSIGLKPELVAGKSAAEITDLVGQKVSSKVVEKLAALGITDFNLPADPALTGADVKQMTLAEFRLLDPDAKSKFSRGGGQVILPGKLNNRLD